MENVLLLAFALPIATILLAIVLQKVLRSPLLVAATFLGVLLIVTYAAFDSSFLVFAIIYTILAYVTAVLTRLVCRIIHCINSNCNNKNIENSEISSENDQLVLMPNTEQNTTLNNNNRFIKRNGNIAYNCVRR